MKKVVLSSLCLLVAACSVEKPCYRENCFITETEVTADMQKIRSILMEYFRTESKRQTEYSLKFAQVTCKLFGKNNKQLNKEIDKLQKIYQSKKKIKENEKLTKDLEKSLKGLKLDYKQVLLLAREMEADYAKILKENVAKFAPYKTRAHEIVKYIDDQEHKQDEWSYGHYEDGLRLGTKFIIYFKMRDILNDNYNKFSSYSTLINTLEGFIEKDVLQDSFLKDHPSSIPPKDERSFNPYYSLYSLVPWTTRDGEIIFDATRKAVSDKKISKQDLSDLVEKISDYLRYMASAIVKIQGDVTDKIDHDTLISSYAESKLSNFYDFFGNRYAITNLVDKNPKFEDFDREINKLSTRLAYQHYYKVNTARFLYQEWRNEYYSQVKEFFENAVKVADRLSEMTKNDVITDTTPDKRRYEYKKNAQNISIIKEIAKIGAEKIISVADCYIDSQEEIKKSLYESFIKTREAYVKNLGHNLSF